MKYSIYVHDLLYEVGHSNVTIDMINNLPNKDVCEFKFICFTCDELKKLFPDIHDQVNVHIVPFSNIKPVLLKVIFFQIYSFIYSLLKDRKRIKISLGISTLRCDFSIIHFIHHQWNNEYFNLIRPEKFRWLYKKVFFYYTNLCEIYLFKINKPKVITVSIFLKEYIVKKFSYNKSKITHIHSGFDLKRFNDSSYTQDQSLKILVSENKELSSIDLDRPICLFVGAFERKGLENLLKQWIKRTGPQQLLVIGKSESSKDIDFTAYSNVIHIPFTMNMNLYYEISDYFFFPTIYEPFGMVLIEAAVKGLIIKSSLKNVGASEVLKDLEGIEFCLTPSQFNLPNTFRKLGTDKRKELVSARVTALDMYNWKNVSKEYAYLLK